MFFLSSKIQHLLDSNGQICTEKQNQLTICKESAESVALQMLGCTLVIFNKPFIITSLELYYGSIGDFSNVIRNKRFISQKGYVGLGQRYKNELWNFTLSEF